MPGPERERGRLVVWCSAGGGTGKSTLAAAMAWYASAHLALRTCAVDFDPTAGLLTAILPEALARPGVLDLARDAAIPTWTDSSPLAVVPAPRIYDPEMEEYLEAGALETMLGHLCDQAELVVVDLGPDHWRSPAALAAWRSAHRTILVTAPHRHSAAPNARLARLLTEARLGGELLALVNFARPDTDVTALRTFLELPVLGAVPLDAGLAGLGPFPMAERMAHRDPWSRAVQQSVEAALR